MSSLHEIEMYLNTDFGADRKCPGKCKANKNQYYYRPAAFGSYYVVQINHDKWMICSDTNKTRELLNENVFHYNGNYAVTSKITEQGRKTMSFHRMYLECMAPNIGDHINRNRFDNRADNLRSVTYAENNRNKSKSTKNTSGKQGVSKCIMKGHQYWRCHIVNDNGKLIFKAFNIDRLGERIAYDLACGQRRLWEHENGYIGA